MPSLTDLLGSTGKDWRAGAPAVADAEFAAALRRIGRPLPGKLLELYRSHDGGEGPLPSEPYNFCLWGIGEVADRRESEHYRKHYDRYVFFGSNGAGEYFGIDDAGRVFFMDAVAGEGSIKVYSDTFDEFVAHIGTCGPRRQA